MLLYPWRFTSLIPKSEWSRITHILVTHGDPDHHWHTDRVAKISGAPVICNSTMLRNVNGIEKMLGPRSRVLAFTAELANVATLGVGEESDHDL